MKLTEFVEHIALAKEDNARWLKYANDLVLDLHVDKKYIPAYCDRCASYKWLYEHSEEINQVHNVFDGFEVDLIEFDIMDQVEILWYDLQDHYQQIVKRLLPRRNNTFFSHFLHLKKQVSEDELSEAKHLLKEMESVVGELNMMLDQLALSYKQVCHLNTS